jgi:hypothetical protein
MNIGDKVILQTDFGPCRAGAQGTIAEIDKNGNIIVEITHDHECNDFTFLLPPSLPDRFRIGTKCP